METNTTLPVLVRALPAVTNVGPNYSAMFEMFIAEFPSQDSKRTYRQALGDFAAFLRPEPESEGPEVIRMLAGTSVHEANAWASAYKSHLAAIRKSPATINLRLAALRALVDWARRMGLVSYKLEVKSEKSKSYRDTRGTGDEGFKKMLASIDCDDIKSRRDRLILSLLYYLGLRRGKLKDVSLEDVDIPTGKIMVMRKGGGSEKFPRSIPDKAKAALIAWLEVRPQNVCPDVLGAPLLCNLDPTARRGRLTTKSIYEIVVVRGKSVGIRAWPHALRHAAITEVLNRSNGNFRLAQQFAEHSDMNTTKIYDDNRHDLAGNASDLLAAD